MNILLVKANILFLFHVSDATFSVQSDVYYVDEDAGSVRVCAELIDGCLQRAIFLDYKTFDGTAISMCLLF